MTKNKGAVFIIEEPTTIELEITDAALIIHDDTQVSLFIPKVDDEDDVVPNYVMYLTVAGALLSNEDPELMSLLDNKIKETIEKVDKDEEDQPDE